MTRAKKLTPRVISMGLVALDVVIGVDNAQEVRLWAGGTCGNVTAILSFLGWSAFPIARLGADFAGEFVSEDLKRWGVHLDYVDRDASVRTPVVIERIRKDKHDQPYHRFSFVCPSCGAWLPSYRSAKVNTVTDLAETITAPDVFFFDRVSPASVYIASTLASQGTLIFFEPSTIGDPRLFQKAMNVAHVIKYSHERVREIAELRSDSNPILEIETMGEEGLRFRLTAGSRPQRWNSIDSFSAGIVRDTAGAGDWCSAGIISRIGAKGLKELRSSSIEDVSGALRYGQALAAWACRYEGPRGGMYEVPLRSVQAAARNILAGSAKEWKVLDSHSRKKTDSVRFVCLECSAKGKALSGADQREPSAKDRRRRSAAG